MNVEETKLIEFLEKEKSKLKADREIIESVSTAVGAFIDRYYSKESAYRAKVKDVSSRNEAFKMFFGEQNPFGDTLISLKSQMEILIDNIISEINALGLPVAKEFKIDKSVNVHTSVNQNQTLNLSIESIISTIKDELTGKQFKELTEIAKNEKSSEKAKKSIIDKLKEFGIDITSNIIANLLTNPEVWTNILK